MELYDSKLHGAYFDHAYAIERPYFIEYINIVIQYQAEKENKTPFEIAEKIFSK